MRARIRATGEILEILDIGVSGKYFYLSNDKKYSRNELEFLSETIDWQHYRIQASIAAMQGQLANQILTENMIESVVDVANFPKVVANASVRIADALVAELKKGGEDDNNHQ